MKILEVKNLRKEYGQGETLVKALDGVNLSVEKGEFLAVVGSSGSGKSTLLHMMGGLDVPTSGEVIVDGRNLAKMKDEQLTIFRRRNIGFVFQSYNLVPMLNVMENITLPLGLDGKKADGAYIREIVKTLGLEEKTESLPSQLSGGQQQRVAIGRALMNHPALILADEPTGNLDSKTSREVIALLHGMSRKYRQSVLMITHNMNIAADADRVFRVTDGCLEEVNSGREAFHE